MMVNASAFPGPALWQGIMMMLLLPYFYFAFEWKDGAYYKHATVAYVAIGVVLSLAIAIKT